MHKKKILFTCREVVHQFTFSISNCHANYSTCFHWQHCNTCFSITNCGEARQDILSYSFGILTYTLLSAKLSCTTPVAHVTKCGISDFPCRPEGFELSSFYGHDLLIWVLIQSRSVMYGTNVGWMSVGSSIIKWLERDGITYQLFAHAGGSGDSNYPAEKQANLALLSNQCIFNG